MQFLGGDIGLVALFWQNFHSLHWDFGLTKGFRTWLYVINGWISPHPFLHNMLAVSSLPWLIRQGC